MKCNVDQSLIKVNTASQNTTLVLRFGGNLKCNIGKMYFIHKITLLMIVFFCFMLYSIFSISFSQEEQIHDFFHLLRIRSLT